MKGGRGEVQSDGRLYFVRLERLIAQDRGGVLLLKCEDAVSMDTIQAK